jgi:hypothetical protein
MKKLNAALVSAIAVFGTSVALAQDAAPGAPPSSSDIHSAEPAPPQGPPAGAQAEGETQIAITPQDIDNFAKAAIELNQIQADGSLDETQKQAAMTAAVESNNLDPVKFNAIAQASKTNAELQQRVQAAISQQQGQ